MELLNYGRRRKYNNEEKNEKKIVSKKNQPHAPQFSTSFTVENNEREKKYQRKIEDNSNRTKQPKKKNNMANTNSHNLKCNEA